VSAVCVVVTGGRTNSARANNDNNSTHKAGNGRGGREDRRAEGETDVRARPRRAGRAGLAVRVGGRIGWEVKTEAGGVERRKTQRKSA
jgi:hypothetical protein